MVGKIAYDRQVVGDEDEGDTHLPPQLVEERDDLCLDRDVEGGNRLVADDQLRFERQSPGNGDALALTTGKLMRITAHMLRSEPDLREEFGNAGPPFGLRENIGMDDPGFGDELVDGHARIERLGRILKDHLKIAAQLVEFGRQ